MPCFGAMKSRGRRFPSREPRPQKRPGRVDHNNTHDSRVGNPGFFIEPSNYRKKSVSWANPVGSPPSPTAIVHISVRFLGSGRRHRHVISTGCHRTGPSLIALAPSHPVRFRTVVADPREPHGVPRKNPFARAENWACVRQYGRK